MIQIAIPSCLLQYQPIRNFTPVSLVSYFFFVFGHLAAKKFSAGIDLLYNLTIIIDQNFFFKIHSSVRIKLFVLRTYFYYFSLLFLLLFRVVIDLGFFFYLDVFLLKKILVIVLALDQNVVLFSLAPDNIVLAVFSIDRNNFCFFGYFILFYFVMFKF